MSEYNLNISNLNRRIHDHIACSAVLLGFSTFVMTFYKDISLDYTSLGITALTGAAGIGGGIAFALDAIKKMNEKSNLESVVKRLEFEKDYNKIKADTPVVYIKK